MLSKIKNKREDSCNGSKNGSKTRIIISTTAARESSKQDAFKPEVIITKEKLHQNTKGVKNERSRRATVEYVQLDNEGYLNTEKKPKKPLETHMTVKENYVYKYSNVGKLL